MLAVKFLIALPSLSLFFGCFFLYRPSSAIFMDLLSDLVAWMAVRATRRPRLAEGVPSPAATCLYHLNIVQDRRQVRSVASGPTGSYWFRRKFVSRIGIYFLDKKKKPVGLCADGRIPRSEQRRLGTVPRPCLPWLDYTLKVVATAAVNLHACCWHFFE